MNMHKARRAEVLEVKAYDYGRADKNDAYWPSWTTVRAGAAGRMALDGVMAELEFHGQSGE